MKKSQAAAMKARWAKVPQKKRSKQGSKLAAARWAKIPKKQRSKEVPTTGGRPRLYPKCPRYQELGHRFSPKTGRCPCGYIRKEN